MENFETSHFAEEEDEKKIQETPETENLNELLNDQYESLIRENRPVDAGNEAFIYKLAVSEEGFAEAKKVLAKAGFVVDRDSAVKVLKVYHPGRAKNEYEFQKLAYDLVEEAIKSGRNDLARIPKPVDFRKIKLHEETRVSLNKMGADLKTDEAEILMMDFIEGEDLQEIFYRWIVKHAPKEKAYAITADPDSADFEQLHQSVAGILEFGHLGPAGSPEADAEIQSRRDKVYAFLKRTGFQIDGAVVNQIKNTRHLLEQNGLYHNDEHERNFMLAGNQAYVIDFSRASKNKPDGETQFLIDEEMRQLSPEHVKKKEDSEMAALAEKISVIASQEGLSNRFSAVYKAAEGGPIQLNRALLARSEAATTTESSVEDFLGLLVRLVNEKKITSSQASEVVGHMKDSLKAPVVKRGKVVGFSIRNPFVHNKIDKYKQLFQ